MREEAIAALKSWGIENGAGQAVFAAGEIVDLVLSVAVGCTSTPNGQRSPKVSDHEEER